MIVLRAVRVEDTGAETELGEIRMTEVGAVYSHLETAEGAGVIRDLVGRVRSEAPPAVKARRRAYDRDRCTCPRHGMYDSGRTGWDPGCSEHGVREQ